MEFDGPVEYEDNIDDICDALEKLRGYHGALELRDTFQLTPLMRAVREDRLDLIQKLITAGANVNAIFKGNFMDEIGITCDHNRTVLVAAIEHYNYDGYYPLDRNRLDIIQCLVNAGAVLDRPEDQRGRDKGERIGLSTTPLEAACCSGLWPVVIKLLEAGSQITICSLMNALRQADSEEELNEELPPVSGIDVVELLIDRSPTLRLKSDCYDLSALGFVVKKGSADFLLLLLQSGKASYGLEECTDEMKFSWDPSSMDMPDELLRVARVLHCRRGTYLQHSLLNLINWMYISLSRDRDYWQKIWKYFTVLSILIDAGMKVHTLDSNSRKLIYFAREWLDRRISDHAELDKRGVAIAYDTLAKAHHYLGKPRRLDELCRSEVRHYLNTHNISVQHFTEQQAVSQILRNYLLYEDIIVPKWYADIDGLVWERSNSSALAMELRFYCSNPSICCTYYGMEFVQ